MRTGMKFSKIKLPVNQYYYRLEVINLFFIYFNIFMIQVVTLFIKLFFVCIIVVGLTSIDQMEKSNKIDTKILRQPERG